MHDTILEIAGLKFHAYPTMLAAAFLTCTLLACRAAARQQPPIYLNPRGGLCAFAGALLGAKIFWILQYSQIQYLWRALLFWEGGLVYYGGLIGGVIGITGYILWNRLPYLRVGDVCVIYLALGQAITRCGCFLNGCCWGAVCDVPWAVRFPKHSYAYKNHLDHGWIDRASETSLPVHPTQLYMVAGLLTIFLLLRWAHRKNLFHGFIVTLYCFSYGVLRFCVEFLRGDSARSVFGMTVSQILSLALIIGAAVVVVLWRSGVFGRPAAVAPGDEADQNTGSGGCG
ncbi:MAG: hypothetical protein GWP08_08025 [Nitrospiraceae bacterium]|nr:hypothetical protein [Nitrospiraceae bacterium]